MFCCSLDCRPFTHSHRSLIHSKLSHRIRQVSSGLEAVLTTAALPVPSVGMSSFHLHSRTGASVKSPFTAAIEAPNEEEDDMLKRLNGHFFKGHKQDLQSEDTCWRSWHARAHELSLRRDVAAAPCPIGLSASREARSSKLTSALCIAPALRCASPLPIQASR